MDWDQLFGVFLEKVNDLALPVNIIVVSDHGMSELKYGIVLSEITDLTDCKVSYSFPPMIYSDDQDRLSQIKSDIKKDGRIKVYTPDETPSNWHMEYRENLGDLILHVSEPSIIIKKPRTISGGTHGYDAVRNKKMSAFFSAQGISFKQEIKVGAFENIHIYPLIAEVLGLKVAEEIDGNLDVLKPILKD